MKREIYDEDHEAFRSSVREFLERSVIPNVEQHAVDKAIPREFWLEAGKQGFLGLEIPEEYGGAGADDYRFNAVMAEELSKVNAALGSCWGIHADITAPYIVAMGTEEQKQRWLPGVAAGEILLAIGMTEPSGGSDLAALKTTAVKDGDDWVINGSKTFITNGYSADLVVTAVRTDPEKGARGITLFAIPADAPGFSRGRKLDKVGQDESDTAELFFEDVRLGEDHIIGELGGGFIAMMQKLPQERLGCSISNVAHAKQILLETIQYTKDRKAFGAPIGTFQHNKFLMAELVTSIEVAEAYIDQCVIAHDKGELTPVDAAKAKWWSSQVQNDVLDHCVQLHGGYGFMNEYRVARAWRDARVSKIWAGSNEIMKELIGRDLGL
ncbi:acyl-CoA dehydrogenase family protein [uncultured Nocardioides sp.]|uniref:acyl-CoA dehydrogenase family protein n=1 Tax=Nocardioides sp. TaxID=35761 RepID=UPI002612921E|nr:acyl-CoA dehydrogenase family protein [uncultured Nocardioides sp.]|tara:strand:+ start:2530 stop:3675 length:1146 start_codon:yes stop_codon:yes gene_type:complete